MSDKPCLLKFECTVAPDHCTRLEDFYLDESYAVSELYKKITQSPAAEKKPTVMMINDSRLLVPKEGDLIFGLDLCMKNPMDKVRIFRVNGESNLELTHEFCVTPVFCPTCGQKTDQLPGFESSMFTVYISDIPIKFPVKCLSNHNFLVKSICALVNSQDDFKTDVLVKDTEYPNSKWAPLKCGSEIPFKPGRKYRVNRIQLGDKIVPTLQ